jgi:shikimate kinase
MKNRYTHIFLTGFMGSGKTTIGKRLATKLGFNFVDLDHYIQHRENKTIDFIFSQEGEESFRMMEANCLAEVINFTEPTIVALGGGTICFGNNLDLVKNGGLLVYLEIAVDDLTIRLKKSQKKRPLLKQIKDEDLTDFISNKLKLRQPFYRQAQLIVKGTKLSADVLAAQILEYNTIHQNN